MVGGPDVWEIIDTARAHEFDGAAILEAHPWLSAGLLEIAMRYFGCFPEEIEALIEDNRYVADGLAVELELVVRERSSSEAPPPGRRSDS